jgi:hypothetical protein
VDQTRAKEISLLRRRRDFSFACHGGSSTAANSK